MSQICRTCLEQVSDTDFLSLDNDASNIKEELHACIPELDLNLIPDATICIYCANLLHAAYDFKQKCLQSEEKIKKHKRRSHHVDLLQIKQEPEYEEKFDIVSGDGIGMDVIFIKDEPKDSNENHFEDGQLNDDHVVSFLEFDDKSSLSNITSGKSTTEVFGNKSMKSNGKTYSTSKTGPKNIKKEPKSSSSKSNNVNAHSVNGKKNFKCDLCAYTTLRENLFKLHCKTHSFSKHQRCEKCAYQACSQNDLQKHMKKCSHSSTKSGVKNGKWSQCTICNFKTLKAEELEKHTKDHLKNMKCDQCAYVASGLHHLKRHLNAHTVEESPKTKKGKPYKCNSCSFSTLYSGAFANHCLIHTGTKPFACDLCGFASIQKVHLQKHMKFHDASYRFNCSKCSFSAPKYYNIEVHMRNGH